MTLNRVWQHKESARLSGVLEQATKPVPTPGDEELVVHIKAAALNPVDQQLAQAPGPLLRFMGAVVPAPSGDTPWIPASDFSGVVYTAGKDSGWKEGEEVYGMKPLSRLDGDGTLQDFLKLHKTDPIARKPANLTHAQAAALPLVYMTVYDAFVNYGKLPFNPKPEEFGKRSVLILGGSSGTGSVAVQLAKKMGLKVVATCSGKNVPFVTGLGADEVIDYKTEHVAEATLMSPFAPYAVVLDCVGGTEVLQHLDHLILHDRGNPQLGIYVTLVGDKTGRDAMGGAITNYYYPSQMLRTFRGSLNDKLPSWTPFKSWITNPRYACIMLSPTQAMLETIPGFLESAKDVLIDSTYKFSETRQAYEKLESGRAVGKIVVQFE